MLTSLQNDVVVRARPRSLHGRELQTLSDTRRGSGKPGLTVQPPATDDYQVKRTVICANRE
jgi:hypothetical protein